MGVDIIRFVEVKHKDGTWHRLNWTEDPHDSNFNYGSGFKWEVYDKYEAYFKNGIPSDSNDEDKKIYQECGYENSSFWITLEDLNNLGNNVYQNLFKVISEKYKSKSTSSDREIREILALLKHEEPRQVEVDEEDDFYESEYQWDDLKITNRFEDIFAIGLRELELIHEDVNKCLAFAECKGEDIFNFDNIRLIYVYNN